MGDRCFCSLAVCIAKLVSQGRYSADHRLTASKYFPNKAICVLLWSKVQLLYYKTIKVRKISVVWIGDLLLIEDMLAYGLNQGPCCRNRTFWILTFSP